MSTEGGNDASAGGRFVMVDDAEGAEAKPPRST